MAGKKGGLINRLIIGSEKSEEYARASLPSNRWELFWDIFKGRFGKLIIINLLMLMFFIPLILLIVFRFMSISGYGALSPYMQPFGVGYQGAESFNGFQETIKFTVNTRLFLYLPIALCIASIGVSGGAYVIRNMVWTEGIFVANDFWRGIKQNIIPMLVIFFVYSVVFYLSSVAIAYENVLIARGTDLNVLIQISKYALVVLMAFFTIMTMHMITLTVTYKLTMRQLFKDAFLLTIGLLPQNIFFLAIAAVPFILFFFTNFFIVMGVILAIILSLSFAMLVWTDYCQWIYDKSINNKLEGAKKNRGIYEKIKKSDSGALKQYREQLIMSGHSSLSNRPIKPITDDELKLAELPTSFNREDINKLNESRKMLYEDNERYIEEHKNDPEFQKSEEELALEKEKEEREKRIEQAKKELAKRDKKKNK